MGVKNFVFLLVVIPFVYSSGLAILLFERAQNWMTPITNELLYQFNISADRYPIMILLISIILCTLQFFISMWVAAWNREEAWDNTTTRDVKERQTGLSYRCQCAHFNEGEQFRFMSVAIILALFIVNNTTADGVNDKFSMDFINYCCTGFIVHRVIFHLMFILNINMLRSLNFAIGFWYTIVLLVSSIYGIGKTSDKLNSSIPSKFKEFNLVQIVDQLLGK